MNISFGSLIIRRLISRYRERAELIRAGGESRAHTEKKARFRHGGHAGGCRGWGGGAGARGKYDLRRSIYLVGTDRASAEKMRYAELRGFLFIQRAAAAARITKSRQPRINHAADFSCTAHTHIRIKPLIY